MKRKRSSNPSQMQLELQLALDDVAPTSAPMPLPLSGLDLAFAKFLQDTEPSDDLCHRLLAALASHQFGRGHACLDLEQLGQGVAVLGWDARLASQLPSGLVAAADSLPWTQGDASPLVREDQRLYLRRSWVAEHSIRAAIDARLQAPCAVPHNLPALLDKLFSRADGSTQPDWQKIACALAARNKLTLVTGGPGTGKTTTVVRLLALLQSAAGATPLRLALAAPTGKAAARLGESIASAIAHLPADMPLIDVPTAMTLHKLLAVRPDRPEQATPELAVDLVVVDEASMIDLEMMARLLAAVPVSATLILLGDKDQLASVEAGAVMAQLCEGADAGHYSAATVEWLQQVADVDVQAWSDAGTTKPLAQQTVMLRFSRRFKDNSGIGIWAKAVNAGDTAQVQTLWQQAPAYSPQAASDVVDRLQPQRNEDAELKALWLNGWQEWLALMRAMENQTCDDEQALAALNAFGKFQVLCAVREGRWGVESLNRQVARALGFQDQGWYAGRPVMVTRNDYNLGLMNGDVGLCLPHAKGLRVAFANGQGGIHWVLPSRLDAVESVFAMTVHKSQGSEFHHVCLVLPDQSVAVLTRELLYTGITRAKARLSLVLPQEPVLWQAVEAKVIRSGGLAG